MKLRHFGPNVGYAPVPFDPKDIGAAGFNSLAVNLTDHPSLPAFVDRCHAAGMAVCGRVVGGSLDRFKSPTHAATAYGALHCDLLTVGNEGDGSVDVNTDGSWIQTLEDWEAMRSAFVSVLGGRVPMYGIGTVTGDPARLDRFPLNGMTGLDNHAYAQWPDGLWRMLGGYDRFDTAYGFKERLISEWGWPDPSARARGKYVFDMVRSVEHLNDTAPAPVVGMFPYCWDHSMHTQPFYLNHSDAIAEIKKLGYGPEAKPAPQPPEPKHDMTWTMNFGILAEAERLAELGVEVGEALEPETYPYANSPYSYQMTSKGLMIYSAKANTVHFIPAEGR